jgi:hypothetical protein
MGIGNSPCGVGPCGHDAVAAASARTVQLPPTVLLDPTTRSWRTENGAIVTGDPVLQEATLALCIELGSIPSDPERGIDVQAIRRARPAELERVVLDKVTRALRRPLAAKELVLLGVVVASTPGRVGFDVSVMLPRDPSSRTTIRGVA